jgi:hypothetical protein
VEHTVSEDWVGLPAEGEVHEVTSEEPETDEIRAQRARERDEIAVTERPLHEFFTRREPYWQDRDRSKYPPHTGMQQRIRAEWPGMSRSQVRDAVRAHLAEKAAEEKAAKDAEVGGYMTIKDVMDIAEEMKRGEG